MGDDAGADRFGFDPTSVFDTVASGYEAARPGYPDALFDALGGVVGPLFGQTVLDVGAGTGISSRALAGRGAKVVAIDPSLAMASTMRSVSGSLPVALGRAEALGARSGAVDLVTFAQAWHWVRLPEAALECRRVLRPDGALAMWWNMSDPSEFNEVLGSECGVYPYGHGEHQDEPARLIELGFSEVVQRAVPWTWTLAAEQWLQTVSTRSQLAKLGEAAADRLDQIEAVVRRCFPGGTVTERFTTRLTIARV